LVECCEIFKFLSLLYNQLSQQSLSINK
jgi:hypothetical protein